MKPQIQYSKKVQVNGTIRNLISIELILLCIFLSLIFAILGCKKTVHDDGAPEKIDLKLVADNLVSPLLLVEAPDDSKRLFIVDQVGAVWIIDKDGTKLPTPFLDIKSRLVSLQTQYDERGLLGLAFHPDYK